MPATHGFPFTSRVTTATFIFGNSITASQCMSARRQLLDLREKIVCDFDAAGAQFLFGREAPRAWQAHAFVREHRRDHRLDTLEVALVTGERARVDGEEGMPDPRLVTLFDEERIGLGADGRAGERGAHQLEGEREHRTLRAADRKQAAVFDRLLRVGSRPAVAVERPALGNLLALL